jgi:flagellar hook-length control protein FliK
LPTVIATLPSNGAVAPNGTATASPTGGGNAFREVLRTANTAAPDQAAKASLKLAGAQPVPAASEPPEPVQEATSEPSVAPPAVDDADAAMAAAGTAAALVPDASESGPASIRAIPWIHGADIATVKGGRSAKPAPPGDSALPAATSSADAIASPQHPAEAAPAASVRVTADSGAEYAISGNPDATVDSGGPPVQPQTEVPGLPRAQSDGVETASAERPDAASTGKIASKTLANAPAAESPPPAKSATTSDCGPRLPQPEAEPSPPPAVGDTTAAADRPDAAAAVKAVQKRLPAAIEGAASTAGAQPPNGTAISTTPLFAPSVPAPAAVTPAAPASSAAASSPAASATPAAQIAPALLTLGQAPDGSRQMTLRLHPAELGSVEVQIGRSETGTARVEITAEKTGTLQALMRDQPDLHRALDEAGIPAAGRSIVFHAAPAAPAGGGSGSASSGSNQGGSGNANGSSTPGGGRSGYAGSEQSGAQARAPGGKTAPARTASYRVGLDIVA